jgi:hypothetical protein
MNTDNIVSMKDNSFSTRNSNQSEYSDLGDFVSEYRRTSWSFVVFLFYFVLPFFMSFTISVGTLYGAIKMKSADMIFLFPIIFLGIFSFWFGWWILKRIFGYSYIVVYDKGLVVTSLWDERQILWENIHNVKPRSGVFVIQLFFVVCWETISLYTPNEKITIESGSGFTFHNFRQLFNNLESYQPKF